MSLATKYRPKEFNDVVGQQQTILTLVNEINNNNIKQAYIFEGVSGSGKTTMSTIMATKLNGLTVNYDVAINNSVDDIKQLLEYVKQKPIDKDKVIVILDEVQNIFNRKDSPAAQALLKILEQPPKHVIFIMCTTEGDKIIDTIKNRCETLHFGAISVDDIANRLQYICNQEHIIFDGVESLKEIAKRSDGSMRNAITNLEKLSSLGNITIANVTKTLASKYDDMFKLLYAYFDEDINTIVSIINNIDDIDKFVSAFFTFVLDIGVFMKTHNINLTSLPTIFKDDLVFRGGEQQDVLYLISNMIELQYHGRNNPIMKSLFKAVLFRKDNDN